MENISLALIREEQTKDLSKTLCSYGSALLGGVIGYSIGDTEGGVICAVVAGLAGHLFGKYAKSFVGKHFSEQRTSDIIFYARYESLAEFVQTTKGKSIVGLDSFIDNSCLDVDHRDALLMDYLAFSLEEKNYEEVSGLIKKITYDDLSIGMVRSYIKGLTDEQLAEGREHLEEFYTKPQWDRLIRYYLSVEKPDEADYARKKARLPFHENKCLRRRIVQLESKILRREIDGC